MKEHVYKIRITERERAQMRQVASAQNTTVAAIIRQAFNLPSAPAKAGDAQ